MIGAVGQHLVKTGLLSADQGKALNRVERARLLADYIGEEIDADKAAWAIAQAESFLEAAGNVC